MTDNPQLTRRLFLRLSAGVISASLVACAAPAPLPFFIHTGDTAAKPDALAPKALKKLLTSLLNEVNSRFIYESDQSIYGEKDYWTTASAASEWRGDCEDHALLCKELLEQRGLNTSMLLTCWTELGEYHCTLYVDGWILDVRHPELKSNTELQQLGYKWHKVGLEDGSWYYVDQSRKS